MNAQEFLERHQVQVRETIDAGKTKFSRNAAIELARTKATKVIALRGEVNLKKDCDDDDLAKLLLGPTGNLKAPTILVGKTLIAGFNLDAYEQYLK